MRIKPWIYNRMAIDDEQKQKDHNEAIAKATNETKKFARNLTSSVSALLKNASNEKQRNQILKEHIKNLKEEIKLEEAKKIVDKEKIKHIQQEIKSSKDLTTGFKIAIPNLKDFGAAVGKYAWDVGKSTVKTAANFIDAGVRVKKYSDLSKEYTGKLGLGMTKLFKIVDFNVGIFKQMSQTGAGFNGNMMEVRDMAKEARMPLLDFVDMMQRNSTVMAGLFGSVQSGVPYMTRLNSQLRDVTKNELAQFGLNLEETGEFLTTYLELERSRGATQRRSTEEVVAGTASYAKNLVLLSKLTGKNIKELDEQTRAVAADGAFRAVIAGKTPEAAKGFEMMLAELDKTNPMIGQLFKEVTAFRGASSTATAQLNMMTGGSLVPAMRAFDGSQESIIRLSNVLKEAGTQGIKNSKMYAMASIAGGDFTDQLSAMAKMAGLAVDPARIREQLKASDAFTKLGVQGYDVMDAIKANYEGMATDVQKKLIEDFGDMLPDVFKTMEESAKKLAEANPLASAYDSTKKAIRVTSSFFSNLGTAKGTGKGTMLSTAEDSVFGMARRAGQRIGAGGQGNSTFDILTPWDTAAEKIKKYEDGMSTGDGMATGTLGATGNLFKDFGSGTQATLHGEEAVVPKHSAMGSVLSMLNQLTAKPSMLATASPTTSDNSRETARMNALLAENIKGLSEVMTKSEKHLNTLVNVGLTQNQKTHELITITKNKTGLAYVG